MLLDLEWITLVFEVSPLKELLKGRVFMIFPLPCLLHLVLSSLIEMQGEIVWRLYLMCLKCLWSVTYRPFDQLPL